MLAYCRTIEQCLDHSLFVGLARSVISHQKQMFGLYLIDRKYQEARMIDVFPNVQDALLTASFYCLVAEPPPLDADTEAIPDQWIAANPCMFPMTFSWRQDSESESSRVLGAETHVWRTGSRKVPCLCGQNHKVGVEVSSRLIGGKQTTARPKSRMFIAYRNS